MNVCRLVTRCQGQLAAGHPSGESWSTDTSGPVVARKYIVTISWFSMLSLFLDATRMPLETTDKVGSRTGPLG